MSEHKISAVLEAKDKFSATIKTANKHLDEMGRAAEKAAQKTASAGARINTGFSAVAKGAKGVKGALKETGACIQAGISTLLKFNMAAMALRGLSAGFNFIKNAFRDFAEFDQVLTQNGAIMNANKKEMADLKTQALELGKTMPFTAKEVAEAQKYQAMAGMKANDILELTPKLLKLSIAAGEDLARTSDILTDNMSAFGLELKEVDKFMDIMAATANNSNTSIAELGEAYQYVAATSRSFESLEEVNILLGIMADNGIKGAKAGRNLGAVYARLAKTTPDMDEALKKVGISLYDNKGKFKGLRNILDEMKPKLAKMTDEQKNYFLTTIAGTEGLKVLTSVLGYSAEGVQKVAGAINNATGAIDENYSRTKDTPLNKIKALESAWDNLKLTIADKAAPAIVEMIDDLTKRIIELADSDTFSKENVEAFFGAIKDGVKGSLEMLELLSTALKPLVWFLKFTKNVGDMGHDIGKAVWDKVEQDKISNQYLVQGYSPEEAEKKAKEEIKEANEVSKMSPSQRKKYYDDKLKKQLEIEEKRKVEQKERFEESKNRENLAKYTANGGKYKGMRYSDYKAPNINETINQNHQSKTEQKNINNNTNSQTGATNLNFQPPQISLNFPNMTVNNEEAIKRISKEIGEEVQLQTANALFSQWNVQR